MISIIAAVARNGVIGGDNRLLWHISEDLKRFKTITMGHPVVMGRKTFESLGRPLPGRENVVITRNRNYRAEGCRIAGSLNEATGFFPPDEEVFVIGGGEVYAHALTCADRVYLTVIEHDYQGDTHFPTTLDPALWEIVAEQRFEHGETFPYPFRYVDYVRKTSI